MHPLNDNKLLIADTLEHINQHLITSSIDTEHYAMALQAVQTDDPISKGIIQAVIAALFSEALAATDASEMLDSVLLSPEVEVMRYAD